MMSDEPPIKRRKLSTETKSDGVSIQTEAITVADDSETGKEVEVGVCAFVNKNAPLLRGFLKTRYTDFLVNEIVLSGEVLHLKNVRSKTSKQSNGKIEQTSDNGPGRLEQNNTNTRESGDKDHTVIERTNSSDVPSKAEGLNREVSIEDREKLIEYLNEDVALQLITYYATLQNDVTKTKLTPIHTPFTSDRTLRGEIHRFIRTTFRGSIDSSTSQDGTLVLTAGASSNGWSSRGNGTQSGNKPRQPKASWEEKGGEYVHFTLYKENKDTMEVLQWLSRRLNSNPKVFQFAGTKDRRAVTTQRCSAHRIDAERLAGSNSSLVRSMVGDFEYQKRGLELGDLKGNEFVITLRDCKMINESDGKHETNVQTFQDRVERSMRSLHKSGYLNYFGLQRFGTFTMRTDVTGRHILRQDFKAACDAILHIPAVLEDDVPDEADSESKISQDDRARAKAIKLFHAEPAHNLRQALDFMPRKFNAESTIMRHLSRNPNDYYGALMMIQRNLRLMYVHAYQSLVWNLAVTQRWQLYGNKVVAGDLVLVSEHKDKVASTVKHEDTSESIEIDVDGEVIIPPSINDSSGQPDDIFERARALTQSEADSGSYTIFDVVMPMPGYDILYPANPSGEFYKEYMASEEGGEMDPYQMRRKQKDFSLSGSYRKILARIEEKWEVQVKKYEKDDTQFVVTDGERLKMKDGKDAVADGRTNTNDPDTSEGEGSKIAVVLRFQLGSSQYATMALRELSKGGIVSYKPEFTGAR